MRSTNDIRLQLQKTNKIQTAQQSPMLGGADFGN